MCGFGFALFIEVVQLITGRGVFETDEACENLEQIVDDFVSDMYMVEEFV